MWLRRFGKNLKRDCRKITLHGFINVSESRTAAEMMFWMVVQIACFALCLWLMAIHWQRYASRPTVTTIKSTAFPISDIEFPAVTVCNSNVVYKGRTVYYEKLLKDKGLNDSLIESYFKNLKYLVHFNTASKVNMKEFKQIENIFMKLGITSEVLMKTLSHPCEEMLRNCTWANVQYNCSEMFRLVKSGLGFCCSFNYYNGVPKELHGLGMFQKPIIADGAGLTHGIGFSLDIAPKQYTSTVVPFYACFVLIHPIWDYSDLSAFSVAMQPGDFGLIQLIPTVFTGDESLRAVSVSERNCLFENEGDNSDAEYSFTNCVLECKQKAIFKLCKCVPFYFPSVETFPLCSLKDVQCLQTNELLYNSIKLTDVHVENSTSCGCRPQCSDVLYDGYVNLIRSSLPEDSTSIYIYYDHSWCIEYGKSLNLTWDMLLASLGGIFGLCLGGSLISLVEILFFTIKSFITTTIEGRKISAETKMFKKFPLQPGILRFEVQPKY